MSTLYVVQQVVESLIAVVSLVGNILVLCIICKNKTLHSVTDYLIGSLAVSDLLVGLAGLPAVMVSNAGLPENFYGCLFVNCIIIALAQVSVFNLMLIAMDRFIAVKYPLAYFRNKQQMVKIGIAIGMTWLLGAFVGFVPLFGFHAPYQHTNEEFICRFLAVMDLKYIVYLCSFCFLLCPVVLMLTTYGYVFHTISKRQITHLHGSNDSRGDSAKEARLSKRIFLILVIFIICWLPLNVINAIFLWTEQTNIYVMVSAVFLSHANSALNPFVYAFTMPKYKRAFVKLLCPFKEPFTPSQSTDKTEDHKVDCTAVL